MDKGLKRSINLPLITLYGVGSILGAGIYVLISEIAGISGMYTPFSFVIAGIIASFSAFSYAEMSSRYPRSAGEAVYVQNAFNINIFSSLVGWAIVLVGIVSVATLANGIVGYVQLFITLPGWMIKTALITLLYFISVLGVKQSVSVAALITVLEVAGLLFTIYFGFESLYNLSFRWKELVPPPDTEIMLSVFFGAFLSFFAYIGFEDMVNMAEEVQNPERNLPASIITVLCITTLLYVLVSIVAVFSLPLEKLSSSSAPFADIIKQTSNFPVSVMGIISLVAILNGMLIQIIMASRVLYGMSNSGLAPAAFSVVNQVTRIPFRATTSVYILITIFALLLPLVSLAKITSTIILVVFASVNISLVVIRIKEKKEGTPLKGKHVSFPLAIPATGFILCVLFLVLQIKSL